MALPHYTDDEKNEIEILSNLIFESRGWYT